MNTTPKPDDRVRVVTIERTKNTPSIRTEQVGRVARTSSDVPGYVMALVYFDDGGCAWFWIEELEPKLPRDDDDPLNPRQRAREYLMNAICSLNGALLGDGLDEAQATAIRASLETIRTAWQTIEKAVKR